MTIDKDGLASLGKPRSEMSRAELYDMIDGLQETVMLCAQRLASAREVALEEAAVAADATEDVVLAVEAIRALKEVR